MNLPFDYDRVAVGEYGGTTPTTTDFENARVVILPIPLDRTTSYVPGTRNGPHESLRAHGAVGRGDEHRCAPHRDLHAAGDGVSVRLDGRGGDADPPRRRRAGRPREVSRGSWRRALDYS